MIKSDVSAQYKTKDCKKYAQTGYCPYGSRCQFIHNNKYLPAMQSNSPTPVISNPIDNTLFNNMGAMLSSPSFNKDAETQRKEPSTPPGDMSPSSTNFFNLINFDPVQTISKPLNQKC